MPDPARCTSCGAPIRWVRTAAGQAMPCDPALVTVVTDDGRTVRGRTSHFATCPTAAEHRQPKAQSRRPPKGGSSTAPPQGADDAAPEV